MTHTGSGPLSYVHNISIRTDTPGQDLSSIAAVASLPPGTRAHSVDLSLLLQRVSNVPGVKECAIRRMPNGSISIYTKMHHAVAMWTDGENYYPLSADGTVVNTPTNARSIAHIVFRGTLPNNISEITRAAHNLIGFIDYLEWIEQRRWNIHTTGGITILLPEENPTVAINTLVNLNTNHNILGKELTVIDMRDSSRILVK